MRTTIWIGIKTFQKTWTYYLIKKQRAKAIKSTQAINAIKKKTNKFDQTDKKIIEKLALNGRLPLRRIAEELKISTDIMIRRYQKTHAKRTIKVII